MSRNSSPASTHLTPRVSAWREAGTFEHVRGHRIFVRSQRRPGDKPTLLLLHGYPSSSYDWRHAFELLGGHDLLTFDFPGFGLSDKPRDHVYSLATQADIAEEIVARYTSGRVIVVAHDMGSSVATELLARDIDNTLSFEPDLAILLNASLVRERASLLWGQKLLLSPFGPIAARLVTEFSFRRQFAGIFSGEHPLSREEAEDQWALLRNGGGHRLLDRLIYYNRERVTDPTATRWRDALRNWPGELQLVWAERDPICTEGVLQAVIELRPQVPVSRLPGLGHYPQLEDPAATIGTIGRLVSAPDMPVR